MFNSFGVNNLALSSSLAGQQSGEWKGLQKPDSETLILWEGRGERCTSIHPGPGAGAQYISTSGEDNWMWSQSQGVF